MASLADQLRGTRIGLSLSSGFFGFFHHAGVILALDELGLAPTRVTGASAGAITGSMLASGMDGRGICDALFAVRLRDFADLRFPPVSGRSFALLGGHRLAARLAEVLPAHSFETCRLPLALGATDLDDGRVRHLSSGALVPAVCASAALPYLLPPVEIAGRTFVDGGVAEKTPLVPFLSGPRVDVVLVSYLPRRTHDAPKARTGLLAFLPSPRSLILSMPPEELVERDRASVTLLREAGVRVLVLAPPRVALGPLSLERGPAAVEQARTGVLRLLESPSEDALGSPDLS
ncbi:MAG: patatin-like phospholipase family protein [Deltaproteobacteria bacterium]|nr:patatin-like phospholipase family protein [Deltaproteobacteria bacterium]